MFIFQKTLQKFKPRKLPQEANVQLSFFEFLKIVAADFRSLLPVNLNEIGNKSLIGAFFELKSLKFVKFSKIINQKA